MTETLMRIKMRMKFTGTTQRELADAVYATCPTMSRWLNGTRQPTIFDVERMIDYLEAKMEVQNER